MPTGRKSPLGDYVVSYIVARITDGKDWLDRAIAAKTGKAA